MSEEIIEKSEIRMLINVAFAGCSRGYVSKAREIFSKLLEVYPDIAAAKVGLAFSYVVVDDFNRGDEILNSVLDADSSNDDARGFLVLSKFLQKNTDAVDTLMNEFVDKDSSGYKLAQSVIDR
jgi:lipoprotein NlpI